MSIVSIFYKVLYVHLEVSVQVCCKFIKRAMPITRIFKATHYILLYLIAVYHYLWSKLVLISHYNMRKRKIEMANNLSISLVVSIGLFWIFLMHFCTMEYISDHKTLIFAPRCFFAQREQVKYSPAQRNVAFHLHWNLLTNYDVTNRKL